MTFAIVVHGGAGAIDGERLELMQEGCKEAALAGWQILQNGGTALDAVETAVRVLEDNPDFNAGTGSTLTADGRVEMDAGMMEGHTLNVGAVAGVECIKNPIVLARKVLESPHVLLAGRGAQQFAGEQGIALCAAEDLITERQRHNWRAAQATQGTEAGEQDEPEQRFVRRVVGPVSANQQAKGTQTRTPRPEQEDKHGTVGATALDMYGNLAAATSTGGIRNKYPGRVGDSPLVGCGFYADEYGAVSCTGHGEDFIRLMIARRAVDFVARGDTAQAAAEAAIAVLGAKAEGTGGLILLDRLGNVGYAWNSEHLARAYMIEGMDEPVAGI
ncbi:MAG TPA: isoaspartyl peptidase/L-asparaginase [Ktedonobacteraceae bacterium]|nr:isoaspartyl peptidase/L-asparaginase [Ktedonobacteraceae bacterium]